MTEVTFYRWRKAYGGMTVHEASRLKTLEQENARRKRLLAERDLALDAPQEVLQKKEPPPKNAPRGFCICSSAAFRSGPPALLSV